VHESPLRIRILVVDDQRIYRQALARLIETQPDFHVVGEAGTSAETVGLCRQSKPDMVVLDFELPAMHGVRVLRELGELTELIRVILITDRADHADVATALQLGARGIITKDDDAEILFRCIRKVHLGEYWITRASVGDLVSAARSLMVHAKRTRHQKFRITPRQHEIIAKVVSGHSNREIAQQFSLSEDTVKRHLTNIFDKLGVSNRLELAVFALHHELHEAS
jgi:two-component system, NarL family, nitrate/nitrite response regulator NarL